MKKLMRKLVLSSFALGLAVITLSTTTFAWYTSNTEVSANKIGGKASTSGSALLLISQDKTSWNTSIDVVQSGESQAMVPVACNVTRTDGKITTAPTFNTWSTANKNATGDALAGTSYIQFVLYFKVAGDESVPLYLKSLTLSNETDADTTTTTVKELPTKDIFAGGKSMINNSESYTDTFYTVDIRRTLLIQTTTTTYQGTPQSTEYGLYDPEKTCTASNGGAISDSLGSTFDAHAYYNHVMGADKAIQEATKPSSLNYGATEVENGTLYQLATIPAQNVNDVNANYVQVVFNVFINGWDLACFDAVQGQTFNLNMTFTSDNA